MVVAVVVNGTVEPFVTNRHKRVAEVWQRRGRAVRLLAVEDCAALGKLLPREECVAEIVPTVKKFAADKSWRVRYMVAQQLYSLCESVGADLARTELL